MIINSNNQTVVVGFLCNFSNASEIKDGCWVNITGSIEKGNYYGEIPVIQIDTLEETEKPENPNVFPPSDTYVPTSSIM